MEALPGAFGTRLSLFLRMGQIFFSILSVLFMCLDVDFYSYTAFCYLVTTMGFIIPWSMTLAVVDAYSLFIKGLPYQPKILILLIIGDWVLSSLSLAAACSTASVAGILLDAHGPLCPLSICTRYQFSAALAFFSWFLSLASCLFNLWILPSL